MKAGSAIRKWVAEHLPESARQMARRVWLGHPNVPAVRGVGTVLDLYYWVCEGSYDTLVPIENIFSPFFPDEDTSTKAWIEIYDGKGKLLGRKMDIPVPHLGSPGIKVSEVLESIGAEGKATYGNLMWLLEVPKSVENRVRSRAPFLFWDRSYIGYTGASDVIAFVHGVDKFEVIDCAGKRIPWPAETTNSFTASPEMPVDLTDYPIVELIQQNRSREERPFELVATDANGKSQSFETRIGGGGVHRFVLSRDNLSELDASKPLRVRLSGLPTRFGRPLAFKRFENGAIAVMHC